EGGAAQHSLRIFGRRGRVFPASCGCALKAGPGYSEHAFRPFTRHGPTPPRTTPDTSERLTLHSRPWFAFVSRQGAGLPPPWLWDHAQAKLEAATQRRQTT